MELGIVGIRFLQEFPRELGQGVVRSVMYVCMFGRGLKERRCLAIGRQGRERLRTEVHTATRDDGSVLDLIDL